jgi:hypothetical protein
MPLTRRQITPSETNRTYAANSLAALEKHYSVADLAKLWLFSESTVRRIFINEPGVLKLVHEETRYKRRYASLAAGHRSRREGQEDRFFLYRWRLGRDSGVERKNAGRVLRTEPERSLDRGPSSTDRDQRSR